MPNNKPIRRVTIIPCACRKSNTYIQMMKSADWLSLPVLVLVAILVVLAGITHALIGVRTRAQARCAVMAIRLTCARWQKLEDEQIPALRTELHSNRPNGSGTNKIVGSRSATPCSIKRSKLHVQTCNRYDDFVRGQPDRPDNGWRAENLAPDRLVAITRCLHSPTSLGLCRSSLP